jgi:endonuclease YncB( thermonuclease family)
MTTTFGPYQATVVAIHDGDTIGVSITLIASRMHRAQPDVDLGFNVHRVDHEGVVLERQSVRLLGCNAPELSTAAGKDALAFLETILHVDDVVTLVSHGWDKYGGRIDGQVTLADGRDLTEVMIAAGQAAPWDGRGAKPIPPTV